MNLDHKKKSNNGLIKIKEHQISRLLEQLKIRDEAIMLAQVELKKNNINKRRDDILDEMVSSNEDDIKLRLNSLLELSNLDQEEYSD